MKTIKFRVWDKEEKKMYDASNALKRNDYVEWFSGELDMCLIGIDNLCANDNFAVMQYTGFTDRNKKEIFEGDLLEYQYFEMACKHKPVKDTRIFVRQSIFVVKSVQELFLEMKYEEAFEYHTAEESEEQKYPTFKDGEQIYNCKVIGNMYENKEIVYE